MGMLEGGGGGTATLTDQYIAGFFDGEGCVFLKKEGKRSFRIYMNICQKNPWVLKNIYEYLGEGILKWEKNSEVWRLFAIGPKASRLLIRLFPFVIAKREVVRLALLWENYRKSRKIQDAPYKIEEYDLGLKIKKRISMLNRRD